MDAELVHGAKVFLEEYGLTVYVDWIDSPEMDRANVTPATAQVLRGIMSSSRMLIYAHTENSGNSKWCPWELGYFDGKKDGNVFILPIVDTDQNSFIGQEYLGLYPYIDQAGQSLFINKSNGIIPHLREAKYKTFKRA